MIQDHGNLTVDGVRAAIETVLQQMGYIIEESRKSSDAWIVKHGSATIQIMYHEHSGFIMSDVSMCTLPNKIEYDILTFLMQQNNILTGLTLSIYDDKILLSILIHDQSIHVDTMLKLLQRQVSIADRLDNILIEKYGADWND